MKLQSVLKKSRCPKNQFFKSGRGPKQVLKK